MAQQVHQKSIVDRITVGYRDRSAAWLDNYAADVWTVTDTDGSSPQTIDFRYKMANGRVLTDMPLLLAAAKEYLFWVRYSGRRMMGAQRQLRLWQALRLVFHAMTIRGMRSLSELSPFDIDAMVIDVSKGVDNLIRASKRISAYLSKFDNAVDLPREISSPAKGWFDPALVLVECSLPETMLLQPSVSNTLAQHRLRLGLPTKAVADIDESVKTSAYVNDFRSMFSDFHLLRHLMVCENILFPWHNLPLGELGVGAKEGEQTPIAPNECVFRLVEGGTKVLVTTGESVLRKYRDLVDGAVVSTHQDRQDCLLKVRATATACFLLIAAFTGRRLSEILTIQRGWLAGRDHNWHIRTKILKKKRKQEAWTVVPTLVAKAFMWLRELGSIGQAPGDGALLFSFFDIVVGKTLRLRPHTILNRFSDQVGASEYKDEKGQRQKWGWQTRQFRRFFAVMFCHRYGGSLEALNHALQHYDLNMTRGYLVVDRSLSQIWVREEYRFKRSIIKDIANDNSTMEGPLVDRLKKYQRRLKRLIHSKLEIVEVDEVDLLMRHATRMKWNITPRAWVSCVCPRTLAAGKIAACQQLAGETNPLGPNFPNAGPTVCPECPWAMTNEKNREFRCSLLNEASEDVAGRGMPGNLFEVLEYENFVELQKFGGQVA